MATLESDLSAAAGGLLLLGKTACRAGKPRFNPSSWFSSRAFADWLVDSRKNFRLGLTNVQSSDLSIRLCASNLGRS